MPESPDFEQIAKRIASAIPSAITRGLVELEVAEQLRVIWNARGASDIAQLEAILTGLMGSTAAGPYVKNLDRALRRLDR